MKRNVAQKILGWVMPVVVGAAAGIAGLTQWRSSPSAVSSAGPSSFVKYGFRANNNAVDLRPPDRNWLAHWTFTAQEPLQQASIAAGVVYISGDGGNLHNRLNNRIYAVDAANGKLLWSRRLNNMSMTTPVAGRNLVYVGTGTQQFQGTNLALEDNLHAVHVVRGTGPSAVYALDSRSGRVVWKYRTSGEDMPSFLLRGQRLYVANGQGKFYAFNSDTGALDWSVPIGSYVSMASLSSGPHGQVYVSGAHPYAVYAINTRTRRIEWRTTLSHVFGGSDDSAPAFSNGRIYVEGTVGTWRHPRSQLIALSAQGGRVLFRTALGGGHLPPDIEVSAPVVVGKRVYVGSPIAHREYAVDAKTGTILWRFEAAGPVSESAAVTPHALYVGDGSGFLYVLNPKNGEELGSRYVSGAMAADYPLVVGRTIYQPDENGQLFALPRASLLTVNEHHAPRIPVPAGALGQEIITGESLFMGNALTGGGLSCDSCHLDGGSITTFQDGHIVPQLLGAAAGFPRVAHHQVRTMDAQINSCLRAMGARPLAPGDPRLAALTVYLHWLASGWPVNLKAPAQSSTSMSGGCK